jgi:septal ring factor EnvC (AmiA/AmiB activator)
MKRVEEISEKADRLEAIKEEKSSKSRDIEHMIRIKQNLSSEYDVEKQKLDQLLAVMNQDEESKNEYIKILADKQKDFEKKLDRIRAQIQEEAKKNDNKKDSRDTGEFGMLKGKMDWPVEGVITEFFGPKKVEGFRGTIQNKGIKIEPSKLGDVRAVYGGTVKYKDAIRGFGNLVIISHTDSYFTLYANMDRVNVETGQQVVKEQVIGTVTVDRLPETPYLYFEIRKHNEALNPSEWLRPNRR